MKNRIGNTTIASLNAVTLRDYVESRKSDGVTGATLAADLSNLSSVLKWARHVKNLDINIDLAKNARQSLSAERIDTRSVERDRIPTEAEIKALCDYFENNPRQKIPMAEIIRFAASSAMRLGEICRIRIEDISWNERSVIIRQRKDPRRKLRNDQEVPLVGVAYDIARRQAEGRTEGRLFPYSAASASTAFTRAVNKLGIEDLHFHDLRHLGITELFRAGLSTPLVAVVSGHKDWKHLKRYTNLNAQDVHAALEGKQL
nr:site-specific integrase [Ruegeria arenilitoris]